MIEKYEVIIKIKRYSCFIFSLLTLLPFIFPLSAAADTDPNRLSIAISGGASKGAYEAGLLWGLVEVLRPFESKDYWTLGGDPRPMVVSSVAGTSAGGINTLLVALTLAVNPEDAGGFANRIDDNIFRDVWLTPDVNRLLPPNADSPQYLPDDALLSRKDLVKVAQDLSKKWRRPGTFRDGIRIALGFTVTRVLPDTMIVSGIEVKNQRFFLPLEFRAGDDGSAHFSFEPGEYPLLRDPAMILMPWSADRAPYSVSNQQIVEILLATSAYPGGFGRRRIQYCRKAPDPSETMSPDASSTETAGAGEKALMCPSGYELAESEFADGGLFDNLPIGLARLLSESGRQNIKNPLPVNYIYVDPNRKRYKTEVTDDQRACAGTNPPDACDEMTFDLASEFDVLGGAIGTARKYELYRELTSDNWRLNLSQISNDIAGIMDAGQPDMQCESLLPYFDGRSKCSDRLRYTGRLLSLCYANIRVPIIAPFSEKFLREAGIASTCRAPSKDAVEGIVAECVVDASQLRKKLADVLIDLTGRVAPENKSLKADIQRSALNVNADRKIHVTSRGGPITGELLGAFGAFLDYKFREFDYYMGVYDSVMVATDNLCARNYPSTSQEAERRACRDRVSEHAYRMIGVPDNAKASYLFALMAKREFGDAKELTYAYDPMPPEDRDIRIIFEGLNRPLSPSLQVATSPEDLISLELGFFEYLKAEKFKPTPPVGGGISLLAQIMDDPEYWSYELVNRATDRVMLLEKRAEDVYKAREPDPKKQEKANAALMGAGTHALRTATYKYPKFTFSPSTAPDPWFWRNLIPYEAAFDVTKGDLLFLWQPTWNFRRVNVGLRTGFGFTGGLFSSNEDKNRQNYGTLGLDLTWIDRSAIFSGWGVTPAVYHCWEDPESRDRTTFGADVHVTLLKNRLRLSLGARDIIDNGGGTIFLTVGIADIPGLVYWLSR